MVFRKDVQVLGDSYHILYGGGRSVTEEEEPQQDRGET